MTIGCDVRRDAEMRVLGSVYPQSGPFNSQAYIIDLCCDTYPAELVAQRWHQIAEDGKSSRG